MRNKALKLAFAASSVVISLAFFLAVLNAKLPAMVTLVLGVLCLAACGTGVAMAFGLESWGGIVLLRSRKGLGLLDGIAKRWPGLWQHFAEVGMVVGYGSLAYFLMNRKKLEWRRELAVYLAGVVLLVVVSGLLPAAMGTLLSMVSGGEEFASASMRIQESMAEFGAIRYVSFALLLIGGMALTTTLSILAYAALVGSAVVWAVLGNAAPLMATSPGGMPIIPGVNLDLFQGIAALAVVLAVHEGAHGVIARLYGLPLKSAGLVFFGFLPFGAFVDIDEKKLVREKKERQNAVFVAGTAANFATSIIFLALLVIFASAAGDLTSWWASPVARFLALTFSLNMIVAAVNLVPIPLFDGYYLMKNAVGSRIAAKCIAGLVALGFLLTLLPWIFR